MGRALNRDRLLDAHVTVYITQTGALAPTAAPSSEVYPTFVVVFVALFFVDNSAFLCCVVISVSDKLFCNLVGKDRILCLMPSFHSHPTRLDEKQSAVDDSAD